MLFFKKQKRRNALVPVNRTKWLPLATPLLAALSVSQGSSIPTWFLPEIRCCFVWSVAEMHPYPFIYQEKRVCKYSLKFSFSTFLKDILTVWNWTNYLCSSEAATLTGEWSIGYSIFLPIQTDLTHSNWFLLVWRRTLIFFLEQPDETRQFKNFKS